MKLLVSALITSFILLNLAHAGKLSRDQIRWCKSQTPPYSKQECEDYFYPISPPPEECPPCPPCPPPDPTGGIWKPGLDTSFYIQLTGDTSNVNVEVDAYETDLFDSDPIPLGVGIAYFSAGSYEDWRPDEGEFPESIKGLGNGWPGEKWLDIRKIDILKPIMAKRMDLAVKKGYKAVDPDNVDHFENDTGFNISYNDTLRYNRMLVDLAHERGLAIALKNDVNQIEDLVGDYEFSVNEECFDFGECNKLKPFIAAGKPVLQIQYDKLYCDEAEALGLYHVLKDWDLGPERITCD